MSRVAVSAADYPINTRPPLLGGVVLLGATLALSAPLCLYTGTTAADYLRTSTIAGLSFGTANFIDQLWRNRTDSNGINWRECFVFASHGFANTLHVGAYIHAVHAFTDLLAPVDLPGRNILLGALDVLSMTYLYGFIFSLKMVAWQRSLGQLLGLPKPATTYRQKMAEGWNLTKKAWWWRASNMSGIIFLGPWIATHLNPMHMSPDAIKFNWVTFYMFWLSVYNSREMSKPKPAPDKT